MQPPPWATGYALVHRLGQGGASAPAAVRPARRRPPDKTPAGCARSTANARVDANGARALGGGAALRSARRSSTRGPGRHGVQGGGRGGCCCCRPRSCSAPPALASCGCDGIIHRFATGPDKLAPRGRTVLRKTVRPRGETVYDSVTPFPRSRLPASVEFINKAGMCVIPSPRMAPSPSPSPSRPAPAPTPTHSPSRGGPGCSAARQSTGSSPSTSGSTPRRPKPDPGHEVELLLNRKTRTTRRHALSGPVAGPRVGGGRVAAGGAWELLPQ